MAFLPTSSSTTSRNRPRSGATKTLFLPAARFDSQREIAGKAPRTTLERVSKSAAERQLTLAAENSPIREFYGLQQPGARIANVVASGLFWYIQAVWGGGPIQAIDAVYTGANILVDPTNCHHYLGDPGQGVDSWLQGAFATNGVTFADTLPGISYSVIRVPISDTTLNLQFKARLRGRKVYDPRENLLKYSNTFTNAIWSKTAGASFSGNVLTTTSASQGFYQLQTDGNSVTKTCAIEVREGTSPSIQFGLTNQNESAKVYYTYTFATGVLTQSGSGFSNVAASATVLPNGNTRLVISGTSPASGTTSIGIFFRNLSAGTSEVYRAQLNSGVSTLPHSETASAIIAPVMAHSDCPSLCMADFIVSTTYGAKGSVDWSSVAACADANDELVGGQKRRTFGLTLDAPRPVSEWINVFETYAAVFVTREGNSYYLIPDRPALPVHHFQHANDDIVRLGQLRRRGALNSPSVTVVKYTDISATQWKTAETSPVKKAGIDSGTLDWVDAIIPMEGIQSYPQAYREAIERHNKTSVADLSFDLWVRDIGMKFRRGEVIEVSHPVGLAAKQMRIADITNELGWYVFALQEYDPGAYSNSLVSGPTFSDTNLPDPGNPPAPTGLSLVEDVYQLEDGSWSSRVTAEWSAADFPYAVQFQVVMKSGGVQIGDGFGNFTTWSSGPVQEGVTYQVEVTTVTALGAASETVASASITPLGKQLLPGNVPSLEGFEVSGEVFLEIGATIDIDPLGYEVRYGAVGVSWADAIFLDFVPAASGVGGRVTSKVVPVGTWDFLACMLDSVRQYSPTPARKTIAVTSDASAFLVDSVDFAAPTLTSMVEYNNGRLDTRRHFVTDNGVVWNTKFPGTFNTYSSVLFSYGPVASEFLTEEEDFASVLSGNWSGELSAEALAGSVSKAMLLRASTGETAQSFAALSAKVGARLARLKAFGDASSVLHVTIPSASVRVDATPRTEPFSVTTLSSGGALVQLANEYSAMKAITITAQASSARKVAYDRVLVAPATGLQFDSVIAGGGGNCYVYWKISTAGGRVVQSGDYLEYDVFVVKNPSSAHMCGGIDLDFSDATAGRNSGLSGDVNGTGALHNPNVTMPVGQWVSRKFNLTPVVGKTITFIDLVNEADAAGTYSAVYRNIRITDGATTTRLQIWSSGEPSLNAVNYSAFLTQGQAGPANSFLAYQFGTSDAQVAGPVTGFFNGI